MSQPTGKGALGGRQDDEEARPGGKQELETLASLPLEASAASSQGPHSEDAPLHGEVPADENRKIPDGSHSILNGVLNGGSDDEKERRAPGDQCGGSPADVTTPSNRTRRAPTASEDSPAAVSRANASGPLPSSEVHVEPRAPCSGGSKEQSAEETSVAPPSREDTTPFQRVSQRIPDGTRQATADAHQRTPFASGDDATRALPTSSLATASMSPEPNEAPPESAAECEWWYTAAASAASTPAVWAPHAALQTREEGSGASPTPDRHKTSAEAFSEERLTSSLHPTPLAPAQTPAVPAAQVAVGSSLATMYSATSPSSRPEKGFGVSSATAPVLGTQAELSSSAAGSKADTSIVNEIGFEQLVD
nr:uncharacterized protein LOC126539791 [Dermacentor andersoni]